GNNITAAELRFQAGAGAYIITTGANSLVFNGAGITNNSGITQNFVAAVNGAGGGGFIIFSNGATAGSMTTFTNNGATVSGGGGGVTNFYNSSTAGHGIFINKAGTVVGAY